MTNLLQIEQAILGALLANNKLYASIKNFQSDYFQDPVHGCIYEAIVQCIENGKPADVATLAEQLEETHVLDEVGGTNYLAQLVAKRDGAHGEAINYNCQRIYEAWGDRQRVSENAQLDAGIELDALIEAHQALAEKARREAAELEQKAAQHAARASVIANLRASLPKAGSHDDDEELFQRTFVGAIQLVLEKANDKSNEGWAQLDEILHRYANCVRKFGPSRSWDLRQGGDPLDNDLPF